MTGQPTAKTRLTVEELTRAVPVEARELAEMIELGMLKPDADGHFRPSDIQRVRAIRAMSSSGISLRELLPAFEAGFFTLQPMDLLYPEPARATGHDHGVLADSVGMSEAEVSRLVVAAGFPAPTRGEPLREDDAELGRMLVEAGTKLGGGDILYRTARILGDSARRAAEGGLALFTEGVADQQMSRDLIRDPRVRHDMNQRGAELMGLAERLLAALFRRHLERAMLAQWAEAAESALDELGVRPAPKLVPGVAFVDLSGYTQLTESAGDAAAARLASRLAELAEQAAVQHRGRVVKLLGDGAMLHFREPGDAARGSAELVELIRREDLPPAHAGAHAGPVIERDGDLFGRTVNLAARIAAQALPGQVLVSQPVFDAARGDLPFSPVGERELKGVGQVALYELDASH
jgi:adenylate cyclase